MKREELSSSISSRGDIARFGLSLARRYLENGDEERAREAVLKDSRLTCTDASVLKGWGEVCEELGMARQARECYERALRIDPSDSDGLFRLAVLLSETGHYEKSLHHLKRLVKRNPQHAEARKLLSKSLRALGFEGQAEILAPPSSPRKDNSTVRYFRPSISERDTGRILRLFSGRERGYAVQEIDPLTAQVSFAFKDKVLGHDEISSHLQGKSTIAVYPLRSDNLVRYGAVSLRIPEPILQSNIKNQGYLGCLEEKLKRNAIRFVRMATNLGLNSYAEDSGERECRIWFFFSEFAHFLKVKRFLESVIEKAPEVESPLVIKPLLPTKPVGLGWLEHPFVLPLGVQRTTLRRSLFLDSGGRPHEEQLKLLKQFREVPLKKALELLKAPSGQCLSEESSSSAIVSSGVEILRKRCRVVGELTGRVSSGKMLRREEKVVLFYTIGLVDRDGDTLHNLLSSCPDYDYENIRRQHERLKPNPVSCLKIRELIPEITASVNCSCAFDLRGGKYPSPLLHVNPHLVPTAKEFVVPGHLNVREAARRYIDLMQHLEEADKTLKRLESILNEHYLKAGIDLFRIEDMVLKRIESDGTRLWVMERC